MARVDPIHPGRLAGDQRALADEMSAAMCRHEPAVAAGADDALGGPFAPMLRFPRFGRPAWEYTKLFMAPETLAPGVCQVAILVVAAHTGARFELHAHELVARDAGLTATQVAILAAGESPPDLDDAQRLAHAVARALVAGGALPGSSYDAAVAAFGEDGAAELIFLVGSYLLLAAIINGYDPPVTGCESRRGQASAG